LSLTITLQAIQLDSLTHYSKYLAIVVTNSDTGECQQGTIIGFHCSDEEAFIGLVLPIYRNTSVVLDGDGYGICSPPPVALIGIALAYLVCSNIKSDCVIYVVIHLPHPNKIWFAYNCWSCLHILSLRTSTASCLCCCSGFQISTEERYYVFKPTGVQAMWSAWMAFTKVCSVAQENNHRKCGSTHTWLSHYTDRVSYI